MRQHIVWIVGGATVVLGIAFAMPSSRGTATAYEPLAGKTWALNGTMLQAVVSTSSVSEISASTESAHPAVVAEVPRTAQKSETPKKLRCDASDRIARGALAPTAPQLPAAANLDVASSSATAIAAPLPAAAADVPQYALENVADRYESDESKFPLDRVTTNAGITIGLVGLERLDKAFVLKVAVANAGTEDFFVKGFTVASAGQDLGSHTIFRLMVEAGRTREGYVMFSKPQSGAAVHIKLQEDGGKGRALDTAIPYPF